LCGGKFEKALQKQEPLYNFLFTYEFKKETSGLWKRRVAARVVQSAQRAIPCVGLEEDVDFQKLRLKGLRQAVEVRG
jgi:hypothetical protein